MTLLFDISQDELPIYLAESDEHLQALDEVLLKLERTPDDGELIQQAFRSAHTLKGMAGMIGHQRMVSLTHALETAFDGLRKHTLSLGEDLVALCLQAVDGLRELRSEVSTGQISAVAVEELVDEFGQTSQPAKVGSAQGLPGPEPQPKLARKPDSGGLQVSARIAPDSIASAARALQIMMALQELGTLEEMQPSLAQIETAAPVQQFAARLQTDRTVEEVERAMQAISDVSDVAVQPMQPIPQLPEEPDLEIPEHLGEYLISRGMITQDQLDAALTEQALQRGLGKRPLVGNLLVALGSISRKDFDDAVASLIQTQRQALNRQKEDEKKTGERRADMTVRTSVERLDALMSLVGELITDRNHLNKIQQKIYNQRQRSDHLDGLSDTIAHLARITDQLQEEVMRIRMLPIGNMFNKFPRLVRDLAAKTGKRIDLVIHGEDTELDRSVIDEINDPLIHLLRNAVDHGIEPPEQRKAAGKSERGRITLSAHHEQGRILITVEDDGRGINPEALRQGAVRKGLLSEDEARSLPDDKALDLIFLSGLSTSASVTDISGRGVGMDIVRNNIQRINGTIAVETRAGWGTTFQIILPLTLAIVPTLLVQVAGTTFAVPLVMVAETLRLSKKDIHTIQGHPTIVLRDRILPLLDTKDVFNLGSGGPASDWFYVVVVHSGKQRAGLIVDRLMGEEEVVVKSLGALIGDVSGISSAAILGEGQVALILDVVEMLKLAEKQERGKA